MVLTEDAIHFLASKKKVDFLRQIEVSKDDGGVPPVKLHVRDRVCISFLLLFLCGSMVFNIFYFVCVCARTYTK